MTTAGPKPAVGLPALPAPAPTSSEPWHDWGTVKPAREDNASQLRTGWSSCWRSIFGRKWGLMVLSLAAGTLAFLVTLAMPSSYQAIALLLIDSPNPPENSVRDAVSNLPPWHEHLGTQVEIIKSRDVLLRAVSSLRLWDEPEFDPRHELGQWSTLVQAIARPGHRQPAVATWTEPNLAAATVRRIQAGANLSVTLISSSQLVKVAFVARDAELAAAVANAIAEQYIAADLATHDRLAGQRNRQLQEQLSLLRRNVTESERALSEYRELSRSSSSTPASMPAGALQRPATISDRLLQARAKRMELESDYARATDATQDGLAPIPAVLADHGVREAQRALTAARAHTDALRAQLGLNHEATRKARGEEAQAARQLSQRERTVVEALAKEYEVARNDEILLERTLRAGRDPAPAAGRQDGQLAAMERQLEQSRQLYELATRRLEQEHLMGQARLAAARIVEAAIPPEIAAKPDRLMIAAAAALASLLLAAASFVVVDRLDKTVRSGEDAERHLQLRLLASLPRLEHVSRRAMALAFVKRTHPSFTDGIRKVLSGIRLADSQTPGQVLLVTSSVPAEGKTTVAINLAFAHAQTNGRTLLIDLDLRSGRASRIVGQGASQLGIAGLLAGKASLDRCVMSVKGTGLHVLPAGTSSSHPLELLLSQRFRDVLVELGKQYPMIVIDSPPVELTSEALVLAPLATQVALVVRAASTPAPLVRKTQRRLQHAGGRLLGVILNGLSLDDARKHEARYVPVHRYDADSRRGLTVPDDASQPHGHGVVARLRGARPWQRVPRTPETRVDEAA